MRVRTPWVRPGRVRYADPSKRYFARFGSPWRRIGAAAVDWTICYVLFVLVSIPLGMLQMIGTVSWEAGDLGGVPGHLLFVIAQILIAAVVLAYWVLLLPTSQTFGMRLADIRLVSMRTGNGLSYFGAAFEASSRQRRRPRSTRSTSTRPRSTRATGSTTPRSSCSTARTSSPELVSRPRSRCSSRRRTEASTTGRSGPPRSTSSSRRHRTSGRGAPSTHSTPRIAEGLSQAETIQKMPSPANPRAHRT